MKISVALCTYNGEKYLREQIDSILKQDCKVDEIVVCDDGSIDDTIMILKEYKKEYPLLFRVYQNAENLGYIKNFEKALLLCTQEVVFLSDQDDIWYQEKVSDVLQYFKENPYKKVLAHNLDLLNSEIKNKTFWDIKDFKNNDQTLSQKELLKYILVNGNKFPGMSIAIHNKTLRKYLPFINNNAFIIHDFEIIIKALRDENFGLIKKPLGGYREHSSQSIGYNKNKEPQNPLNTIHSLIKIKKSIQDFRLDPELQNYIQKEIQNKYTEYLEQFSFLKRLYIHAKIKYYYKMF